uniref:hypothetical protein n=1 Tax=Streptomyces otsuchiensis TaxID=2681388 RepID=UPI003F68B4CF
DVPLGQHGTPRLPAPAPERDAPAPPVPGQDPRVGYGARADAGPASFVVEPTELEASLATVVHGIGAEIRQYVATHPGARVRVTWQVIEDGHAAERRPGTAEDEGRD